MTEIDKNNHLLSDIELNYIKRPDMNYFIYMFLFISMLFQTCNGISKENKIIFSYHENDSLTKVCRIDLRTLQKHEIFNITSTVFDQEISFSKKYISYTERFNRGGRLVCVDIKTNRKFTVSSNFSDAVWFSNSDTLVFYSPALNKNTIFKFDPKSKLIQPFVIDKNFGQLTLLKISPENDYLCYSHGGYGVGLGLYIVDLRNNTTYKLLDETHFNFYGIQFIKGKSEVVFVSEEDPLLDDLQIGIFKYNFKTNDIDKLLDLDEMFDMRGNYAYLTYVSISNNGRFLAFFDNDKKKGTRLFIFDILNKKLENFIIPCQAKETAKSPLWSKDDSKIYFIQGIENDTKIMQYDVNSNRVVKEITDYFKDLRILRLD